MSLLRIFIEKNYIILRQVMFLTSRSQGVNWSNRSGATEIVSSMIKTVSGGLKLKTFPDTKASGGRLPFKFSMHALQIKPVRLLRIFLDFT